MQKEITIFLISVSDLYADALWLWQILILWQTEQFFNDSFGGSIVVPLVLAALGFLWFSFVLLCKIIERLTD